MDQFHLAIGVTTVLAMIVIMASTVSCVGSRVADQTSCDFVILVTRGSPLGNQLSAVEGEPPLVEGEYIDATCSAVKSITSTASAVVGPYLPRLPSLAKLGEEKKEADTDKKEADTDKKKADTDKKPEEEAPDWSDPTGEES